MGKIFSCGLLLVLTLAALAATAPTALASNAGPGFP
jgi:hypothetical protein